MDELCPSISLLFIITSERRCIMEEFEPNYKNMVFYGVAWFIACILLVLALLNTIEFFRTIMDWIASGITDHNKLLEFGWNKTAITEGLFFVGGIFAVGMAVWLEYYFRKGEKVGKLAQRVARVFITEILIIIIMITGRLVIAWIAARG
jgi:hypothetical protein